MKNSLEAKQKPLCNQWHKEIAPYGLSPNANTSSLAAVDFFAEMDMRSFAMAVLSTSFQADSAKTTSVALGPA